MSIDYLITGGAGFIGCALSKQLLSGEHGAQPSIMAIDCLHPQVHQGKGRPADLPEPVQLMVMDVCESDKWDEILAQDRPGTIIHLAAETGTGQSLEEPARHTHVNVTGTARMLEALDRAGHVPSHIFLASSRAVYGEGKWLDPADKRIFTPDHRSVEQMVSGHFDVIAPSGEVAVPLPQDHRVTAPLPTSIYGVTKLAQEQLVRLWCIARGVPLSILRLQNVYGPGQSPHNSYTGIVGLFHRVAARRMPIEVYEDGRIGRDFVFIDDVARCIRAAVTEPPAALRLLDVGSGSAMTIMEAARIIAALYDAPEPLISGAFRHGDIRWAFASVDDLAEELRCAATIDFKEGNRRLAEWLRVEGITQ